MCVCVYCESCMYLVCRASVLSFRWSGVRRVELQLRVCCEWGVIGDQVGAVVRDCSFTGGLGVTTTTTQMTGTPHLSSNYHQ